MAPRLPVAAGGIVPVASWPAMRWRAQWSTSYDRGVQPPTIGDDWCGLTRDPVPVHAAGDWVVRPDCGAVVVFSGTARDHSEGLVGVTALDYEAYDQEVIPRLADVARQARVRWPVIGRLAMIHRIGLVSVGESAVVVAVSAPHRAEAFAAAQWSMDTLKATVPIWKHEQGGRDGSGDA
jgi:molybdopterin synthase catalytic subunit